MTQLRKALVQFHPLNSNFTLRKLLWKYRSTQSASLPSWWPLVIPSGLIVAIPFTRSAPLYASYACSSRSSNTSQPASLVSFWWYLGEGGMYMFLGEPCNDSFWRTAWTSAASGIGKNGTACGQEPEEPCRLARFPIVESWLWRASDRQEHDHQLESAHLLLCRIPNELPSYPVPYRVSILIDNYRTPSIFDAELIEVSRSLPSRLITRSIHCCLQYLRHGIQHLC